MLPTNDAVLNAFQLLAATVRDLYSRQQHCLGAKLKPELYRRYGFREQQLGFMKFGEFLRAAENAGYIRLTPTPGGDIQVWPAGMPANSQSFQPTSPPNLAPPVGPPSTQFPAKLWSIAPSSPGPIRIRQDLWNAFNSYFAMWVYDRTNDVAYKLGEKSFEAGEDPKSRLGPNLVPIPSGRDRVLDWMRSFANMQDPDVKTRLLGSLQGESAQYHFNNAASADPKLHRAWRRYHIQQVLAAIEAWTAANNLRPKCVTEPFDRAQRMYWSVRPPAAPIVAPQQPTPAALATPPPSLTPRLAALIDETIDQLLRLRGMLQVVGSKH